jgi:hypothetical protein
MFTMDMSGISLKAMRLGGQNSEPFPFLRTKMKKPSELTEGS